MDDEQPSEHSENENSSKKIGRRGFIVTLGFGVAASAVLRKLHGNHKNFTEPGFHKVFVVFVKFP